MGLVWKICQSHDSCWLQSHDEHTSFVKHSILGGVTAQLVYVDDIIVTGNDLEEREALKCCLAKEFEIK